MEINENMVFALNRDRSPQDVDLLQLEWAVVTQLDGEKTVGQIAENLALNPEEIQEIFKKLIKEEILYLADQSMEDIYVPKEIFDNINHSLTLLLGPVSDIILEDTFKLLQRKPDRLEKQYLPTLIDLLTNQIDDPQKKIEFQKNLYPQIKKFIL
jgi:predicted nucleotidyltransferase